MQNGQILCSTGAFIGRVNGRNHRLIIECAEKLHCDGFEFLMFNSWTSTIKEITRDLADSGLSFPVFHADKTIGERLSRNEGTDCAEAVALFQRNCEAACTLGSKLLVLHLWGGPPSDKNMEFNIGQFDILDQLARRHGLLLSVENVVCNTQDPLQHMKTLTQKYQNIAFTLDTKFAAFHSQMDTLYEDNTSWLWKHVRHIHINDYRGGPMDWANLRGLHPGEGDVDFDKLFLFLHKINYQSTITLESTSMSEDGINFTSLNKSLDYIRKARNASIYT